MQKTIKLYDNDAYQTEFQAVVLSCEPHVGSAPGGSASPDGSDNSAASDVLYDIILDQTLFFPEEGGQNADSGMINGQPVSDVQIQDDVIRHTVAAPFAPGATVTGSINWDMRYSNMQQHSGEHIMSGLIHTHFGYNNVGFHLGSQNVTLDFNGFLDDSQLEIMETLANEAIYKNLEIEAVYPSAESLAAMTYRSKIEIDGPVRIVTIPDYDVCACCAPHVRRTGEIGMIKIVDAIKYKGGVRISILCGSRALADYRAKQERNTAVSVLLSAKPEVIADAVTRLKEENFSLKGQLMELESSLIEQKAALIPDGTQNICLFEETLESAAHRKYVNLLVEKCSGICAVFVGNDADGYRYIIASKSTDVRTVGESLKKEFQARGGGSAEMIQGSVSANRASLESVLS